MSRDFRMEGGEPRPESGSTADMGAIPDAAVLARASGSLDGVATDPSHPWTWSAPLLALGRTPVRLHASFMALVLLQMIRVIRPGPSGPLPDAMALMLVSLVTLAWLALLADAMREWAARLSGGTSGPIVVWPAGGLSWRDAPGPWSTRLAVALAAPVTTVVLSSALGIAIMLRTGRWDLALPNPWDMDGLDALKGDDLGATLWLIQWTNVALLAASIVPAHPFAGGRALEAILEPWLGREGASRATLVIGIVVGATVAIAGLAGGSMIAILCGAVAIMSGMHGGRLMRLKPGMLGLGLWTMVMSDAARAARDRSGAREAKQRMEDDAALDAILQKVALSGIESLSRQELQVLERSTARRRAGKTDPPR
jgi:hypothetical protein